jgi:hypothetical protein
LKADPPEAEKTICDHRDGEFLVEQKVMQSSAKKAAQSEVQFNSHWVGCARAFDLEAANLNAT